MGKGTNPTFASFADKKKKKKRGKTPALKDAFAVSVRDTATDEVKAMGDTERVNGIEYNHGGSPVTRWRNAKMLKPVHEAAIAYCLNIWGWIGTIPRTTALYGERTSPSSDAGDSGRVILAKLNAQDSLARVQGYVTTSQWNIFENCVRWDEPAGVIGSRLGFGTRTAGTRAHQTVCLVAEIIAHKEGLQYER